MTSGGSRGGALSLFLHQIEARRAEKIVFGDQPSPLYLRVLDERAPRFSQGLDPAVMTVVGR